MRENKFSTYTASDGTHVEGAIFKMSRHTMKRQSARLSIAVAAKFLLLLAIHISIFASLTASASEGSIQQEPLSAYYKRVYDGLEMAEWIYDKKTLDSDYAASLAVSLTEVQVGNHRYQTPAIIRNFLSAAFAPPSSYSIYIPTRPSGAMYADSLVRPPSSVYWSWRRGGENYEKAFQDDYAWIQDLLSGNSLSPRMPAINKWMQPVTVSTGLPNDLVPYGSGIGRGEVLPFAPPYDRRYLDGEAVIAETVKSLANELSELTGVPLVFVAPEEEGASNLAKVRIVLTDRYDPATSIYRLSHEPRAIQSDEQDGYPSDPQGFRERIESQFHHAVRFTPSVETGLDGYFIPDANNQIMFATCYIWHGHSTLMIRALTSECLLRSLGLPDVASARGPAFLEPWNANLAATSTRDNPNGVPAGLSDFDKLLLRMLYQRDLTPGSSPYQVRNFFFEYFEDETHQHIKER